MTPTCARESCQRRAWRWGKGYCEHHAFALGIREHRVPSAPVTAHLQACLAAGATRHAIAEQTGVDLNIVSYTARGERKTMHAATARRLMKATPTMNDKPPVWPIARRLRSLRAAGWTLAELHDGTGLDVATIIDLSEDRPSHLMPATDRAVRGFYAAHRNDPVKTPHPRVAKRGWPTPWAWDDIDDPTEVPDPAFESLSDLLAALVRRMGSQKDVADAVGMHPGHLHNLLTGRYAGSAKWEPIFRDLWKSLTTQEAAA